MILRNRVITSMNPQMYILACKQDNDDPKKQICLLNPVGEEPKYSLWNVEYIDEERFRMTPYKGNDSVELIDELLDVFVEHAHEVL